MSIDLDLIRGLIIILLLASFFGMAIWLWFFADRRQLEEAAHLPLQDTPVNRASPRPSAVAEEAAHE